MDRKKAIEGLEALLKYNHIGRLSGADIETLNFAIDSLKVDEMYQLLFEDPGRVIIVPEDATNGDAILAIFPDAEHYHNNNVIDTDIDGGTLYHEDWWEAPYKRGNGNDEKID